VQVQPQVWDGHGFRPAAGPDARKGTPDPA
jgi:hypothetical protein